jgi:hypothetical protein
MLHWRSMIATNDLATSAGSNGQLYNARNNPSVATAMAISSATVELLVVL